MTTETFVALITGLGGGPIIVSAIRALWVHVTGRQRRARDEATQVWMKLDREAARRRRLQEYSSVLRRELIEAPCVDNGSIPPWPGDTGVVKTNDVGGK